MKRSFLLLVSAASLAVAPLHAASHPPQLLRAGPVTLTLADGDLHYLRVGGVEIARRVFVSVRDTKWDTQEPEFARYEVKQQGDSFTAQLEATCRGRGIDYSWRGQITGAADGTITFKVNGVANADCKANRFGLCVLFGDGLRGQSYEVLEASGAVKSNAFPVLIDSVILADKFHTLSYTTDVGLGVSASVAGALFGMEDQRHFGDASYKAFSSMPYPYPNITKGAEGSETITIAIRRPASAPSPFRAEAGTTTIRLGAPQPGANLPRLLPFNAAQANGKFFLDAYKKRASLTNESFYTWPLNVAVNLFDNDTWMENSRTPLDQARTVRAIAPRAKQRVAVSLHAPYARVAPDPRSTNQFAAAWTVAVMANLCRAGVDEAMFDLDAPRPQEVFQRFEKLVGQHVLVSMNSESGARRAVESLALRDGATTTVFLANLTGQPQEVAVEGLEGDAKLGLHRFTEKSKTGSPWSRSTPGRRKDALRLQLSAYEVCELTAASRPWKNPPTQFTLMDDTLRFVPVWNDTNMTAEAVAVWQESWARRFPDSELNHGSDGFRLIFDRPDDLRWKPRMRRSQEIPDNWLAPVNYYDGDIHYRVEVLEKPNTDVVTSLFLRVTTESFEGTHNVWLGNNTVAFREPGTYRFTHPVLANRPFIRDTQFRFDRPLYTMQLVVGDQRGAVVHHWVEQGHNKFQGSPDLGLYLPLKARYTAIVTARGAKFEPPPWW